MRTSVAQRAVLDALAAIAVLAAAALLGVWPASAAMRRCGPLVASEIVSAPTALDAKARALSQWRAAALKLGRGFDSWRIASDKALKCVSKKDAAGTECVAIGRPCIIEQKLKPRPPAAGKAVAI